MRPFREYSNTVLHLEVGCTLLHEKNSNLLMTSRFISKTTAYLSIIKEQKENKNVYTVKQHITSTLSCEKFEHIATVREVG